MDEKLIAKNFVEKLIEVGKIESIQDACSQYKDAVVLLGDEYAKIGSVEEAEATIKEFFTRNKDLLKEIYQEHPEFFK